MSEIRNQKYYKNDSKDNVHMNSSYGQCYVLGVKMVRF